ncbi:beta-alanine-activating enzyme [Dunckerocampus dactyliophorus]|uniref:beta-alanine-activating enzyme n=1 Tax=Dunckerocampus dactyliophorus TaxID=161453 RepID=UPI002405ECC6|nr:beta-alanine-activating enzyme [Dunckerocampus dactyliophorus]
MDSSGTLQGLVTAAASVYSHRVAVTFDGGSWSDGPVCLVYKELLQLSSELSLTLKENCKPNNGMIGLCCSDDLLTPVWILGILQTPAAYVPLDPGAPGLLSSRVMITCGLEYCAVKSDFLQQFHAALGQHVTVEVCAVLPKFKLTLVKVMPLPDAEHKQEAKQPGSLHTSGKGGLAYVLHTSGTTGLPKIVRVPHQCILPNILHLRSLFQMTADDVVFLASPLTFDPSVVDIFLALSSGAQLLIVPAVLKKIPMRLSRLLFRRNKTTLLQATPTLLSRFGPRLLKQDVFSSGSSLRVLALGGESCPSPSVLSAWRHEDNKTDIYNIYGITEVSCWACCYRIPPSHLQQSSNISASSVPLGTPLMGTRVEVRDEDGGVVKEGEGQVFIGGEERVCLLDHEESVVAGTMRATGDWVDVRHGQLFYLGRKDRAIKRHGKRVNLDNLQQLLLSLPEVEACAVCLHEEASRLLAFVVTEVSAGRNQALPPSSGCRGDPMRRLLEQLTPLLPSYGIPDTVVLVPALPLTPHGKVDMRALVNIYQRQRFNADPSHVDVAELEQTLRTLWQDALGLEYNSAFDEGSNFLFSGGDSLKALRLCEDILAATGASSPQLVEVLLDGTFIDVLRHLTEKPRLDNSPEGTKRRAETALAARAKRERSSIFRPHGGAEERQTVTVLRRGGDFTEMSIRRSIQAESTALSLSVSWSSDTGRCVDASPVLLVQEGQDGIKTTVFIGSHSHRMQALDLDTGSLLWERVLGGRIEASAAVSQCGRFVVVGCYDGGVYVLHASSGETRWVFETGDAVKSSAAVDPLTALLIVGSHDGFVYALNLELLQCVWRRHCGGGAVFSSPHFDPSHRQLYVATLGGKLLCLHPDSGDVLWSHSRNVPFFSSPNCSSGGVVIGSVDGNICCFSNVGKALWQFPTEGPVFSSPCVTADQEKILCGSHDGRLYCLNSGDGSLRWTFQTAGKVFSSPCMFDAGRHVGVASTEGTVYILDGQDGHMLSSWKLPGELFSSLVVYGRSVVVGCRNDYVYCLTLET